MPRSTSSRLRACSAARFPQSRFSRPGPGTVRATAAWPAAEPGGPNGFVVFSHSGDDFKLCRDHVTRRLASTPRAGANRASVSRNRRRLKTRPRGPLWLWRQRRRIAEDSPAWRYLRQARRYGGPIPAALGFLPRGASIRRFDRGVRHRQRTGAWRAAIADADVRAVQLIKLKPDGSGKANVEPNKITVGREALGVPIVCAPVNDLLGLAITEGIEDAIRSTRRRASAVGERGATRMPALADAVPSYVECITILGDDDGAGRRDATESASTPSRRAASKPS